MNTPYSQIVEFCKKKMHQNYNVKYFYISFTKIFMR